MLGEELPPPLPKCIILWGLWVEGQGLEDAVLGKSYRMCWAAGERSILLGCTVVPHGEFLCILFRKAFKLPPDELQPFLWEKESAMFSYSHKMKGAEPCPSLPAELWSKVGMPIVHGIFLMFIRKRDKRKHFRLQKHVQEMCLAIGLWIHLLQFNELPLRAAPKPHSGAVHGWCLCLQSQAGRGRIRQGRIGHHWSGLKIQFHFGSKNILA